MEKKGHERKVGTRKENSQTHTGNMFVDLPALTVCVVWYSRGRRRKPSSTTFLVFYFVEKNLPFILLKKLKFSWIVRMKSRNSCPFSFTKM